MKPSLLDRLLDTGSDTRGESVNIRGITYGELRDQVERDLESLLNTRCFPAEIPTAFSEIRKSLLLYGLSDYSAKIVTTPSVRSELRQEIERAIALFEPRLRNVAVRVENPERGERRLGFKISALLQVDDDHAEQVRFDTVFDSNRGEYSISSQ